MLAAAGMAGSLRPVIDLSLGVSPRSQRIFLIWSFPEQDLFIVHLPSLIKSAFISPILALTFPLEGWRFFVVTGSIPDPSGLYGLDMDADFFGMYVLFLWSYLAT